MKLKPGPEPGSGTADVDKETGLAIAAAAMELAPDTWPSVAKVADATGLSTSTVNRHSGSLNPARRAWTAAHGDHPHWTDPDKKDGGMPTGAPEGEGSDEAATDEATADADDAGAEKTAAETPGPSKDAARVRRLTAELRKEREAHAVTRQRLRIAEDLIERLQKGLRPALKIKGAPVAEEGDEAPDWIVGGGDEEKPATAAHGSPGRGGGRGKRS